MAPLEVKPLLGASRKWRRWPRRQRGPSCSCCPVAVRDGGATKEQQPPWKRSSSRSPLDGRASISPGRPSPGCLGHDGGGGSGGGLRREGLQGTLVATPFRATASPRCRRRRLRRLNLFLAPLRDLVTAGSGTAKGRHDRVGLGKERLEVRGEVGGCPQQRACSAFKEERLRE
jgi:hypothetical protein